MASSSSGCHRKYSVGLALAEKGMAMNILLATFFFLVVALDDNVFQGFVPWCHCGDVPRSGALGTSFQVLGGLGIQSTLVAGGQEGICKGRPIYYMLFFIMTPNSLLDSPCVLI